MNRARERAQAYQHCPLVPRRQQLANQAVVDAMNLADGVRELDPREVWGTLAIWNRHNPNRLYAAVTCLAAMVDTDRTAGELLAWTGEAV